MTVRWWHRFRVARRTAIGLATLALLGVVGSIGAAWRASWIINRLLREWAAGEIAHQSGGVYQLDLSPLHFDWGFARVVVDSISIATRRGVNAKRPQSLPGVHLALYDCTVSGVHVFTLIRRHGLVAGSFGCRTGSLVVEVPYDVHPAQPGGATPARAGHAFAERDPLLLVQQRIRLPSYAPLVHVAYVTFPQLALEVRLPGAGIGTNSLSLERLQWVMTDVAIDPADTVAATRPLFSRSIDLVAHNFITRSERATAVRVGLLKTSLTDSTLEIGDVRYAPSAREGGIRHAPRYRNDVIALSVGHIRARGIDFGAFITGKGVLARRVEVDSLRLDVTTDKRLPEDPRRTLHRTPQQWIADLDETLSLDSLQVQHGQVIYREHAEGREQPGLISFARINATATNVSHVVGRRTSGDPMTLSVRAYFQGVGPLDVRIVVPLDAPRFDMSIRGTLGAMPATALNAFIVETNAVRIDHGQVDGVSFSLAAHGGVLNGTIAPRYNDLSISITKTGSGGILGGGGLLGGAVRGIASFAARRMLYGGNPDKSSGPLRVGTIDHTFSADETLVGFIWPSVRDGLLSVVKR